MKSPPRDEGHSRRGFTLAEFLVASILAVLLMVILVNLFRAVWQQNRLARRTSAKYPPTSLLESQIQRDFVNARYLDQASGAVRLVGYLATDPETKLPTLRRAEVTYTIVRGGGTPRLMRREVALDGPAAVAVDLLWIGAASLELVRYDVGFQDGRAAGSRPAATAEPIPGHLGIVVRDRRGQIICAEEIYHHDT